MRSIVTTKRLAVAAMGGALLLIAAALLVSRDAPQPPKEFLAPNAAIAVNVEMDDPGHFLGEPFPVAIVVQYRPEAVQLEPDSLRRLSFAPFEPTGVVFLERRTLDAGIMEYRYTTEIRAIELVPGHTYTPQPGTLVYARSPAGAKESLTVAFLEPLQVSAYYWDKATDTPYRPLRTELLPGTLYSRLLASTASLLFLAFGLLTVRWGETRWTGLAPRPKSSNSGGFRRRSPALRTRHGSPRRIPGRGSNSSKASSSTRVRS